VTTTTLRFGVCDYCDQPAVIKAVIWHHTPGVVGWWIRVLERLMVARRWQRACGEHQGRMIGDLREVSDAH